MSRYLTPDDETTIRALYEQCSDSVIAEIIGKCDRTVYLYRKRNGLQRPKKYPAVVKHAAREVSGRFAPVDPSKPSPRCPLWTSILGMRWAA